MLDHRNIQMTISNTPPSVAAILVEHPLALHDTLASFALALRERGRGVRGILATSRRLANGWHVPALVDLDSCRTYLPASRQAAARNDNAALRALLHDIARRGADLALIPRFTAAEAAGHGYAATLDALIASGTPILTTVGSPHYAAWQAFTNNRFVLLPPSLDALFSWIDSVWQAGRRPERH